ncbi:DUF2778 domain-containing protein [Pantoea sp. SO10]|uniref:DUF2778 domain-containing protein n=1 Tax=Pantoea sp. SO10 TaxID=2575375 RepID=UPI0010C9A6D7|nr:DUF2778 domain-containing protein [Pantoea sp. SO10]QCP61374.1 DUF2778 domain-containing protein [Pantoea sp. SO10]
MAIQGKFILNGADIAPLTIYGVGTFMAFSGQQNYINKGGCAHIKSLGPTPPGNYYIVDRPWGRLGNMLRAAAADIALSIKRGTIVDHYEWFALYRDDGIIDDDTFYEGVARGNFRLHPGQISEGCITLVHRTDFYRIKTAILNQPQFYIPGTKIKAYGKIEVISNGTFCP